MTENPFTPPEANLDASVPQRINEAEAAVVKKKIERLNRISLLLGAPGLLLQVVGQIVGDEPYVLLGSGLTVAGTILLIAGLASFARMRGRSGWWAALGLLSCFGLLALIVLSRHCHHCGRRANKKLCENCGAPTPY